jgi:outer membrane lipoprotein SlyB
METSQKMRIHSLAAGAAVAVIIAAAPSPVVAQAAPGCHNCGVVQSVHVFQQKPRHSPVGMIGGAVVGGLVGSQIGHGATNTVATVGGAAGGAYLGNKIGKNVEKQTRYKVVLRMDDGRTRTVTYAARPQFPVGSHVRLENGRMLPA